MRQIASVAAVPSKAEYLGFERFFRETYPRLAQTMLLLTGSPDEAQEVAQEAMARVFERWDKVRVMSSPGGYVYRTALNLHRKRARRAVLRRNLLPHRSHDIDEIGTAVLRQDLRRALAALPRAQREALVLVDWVGLDAREAGLVLEIKPVSVRGRVHRARRSLREQLGGLNE